MTAVEGEGSTSVEPFPILQAMFERQLKLQRESFKVDPADLGGPTLADYLRSMAWALVDEVSEFMDEVSWKPWASDQGAVYNRDAAVSELVDCFHFLINLCLALGVDAEEVGRVYMQKAEKNRARQAAGYDGRTGKCRGCGRGLDDNGVTCDEQVCRRDEEKL